jgi:DNA-binding NarL/FixJ family response regulator
VFSRRGRFNIVAKSDSAEAAIKIADRHKPDVLFVDPSRARRHLCRHQAHHLGQRHTKVMVYTACTGVDQALKALGNGASAFVVKFSISDELFSAVGAVLRGEIFVSHGHAGLGLSGLRNRTARNNSAQAAQLSQREQQVVGQLLHAWSNRRSP